MPVYEYHCTSCGADLEIFQRMSDPALTECPQCRGKLRKVFSPVGIVFKGSGFYATDSKKGTSAATVPGKSSSSASGDGTGGAKAEGTSGGANPDSGSTTPSPAPSGTPAPSSPTSTAGTPGTPAP